MRARGICFGTVWVPVYVFFGFLGAGGGKVAQDIELEEPVAQDVEPGGQDIRASWKATRTFEPGPRHSSLVARTRHYLENLATVRNTRECLDTELAVS